MTRAWYSTFAEIDPTIWDIVTAIGVVLFFMTLAAAVTWPGEDRC